MMPLAMLALATACITIDGQSDRITAGDVAHVLPEWSRVRPLEPVALAPAPGVIRRFHAEEIRRLGVRFGVESSPAEDICFQRPVHVIPQDRMLAAMKTRLPEASIAIVESSRVPAPDGELDFPLSGLRQNYWLGTVRYGAGHKFTVWARVNIALHLKCVVASTDLKPGMPIQPGDLRLETSDNLKPEQMANYPANIDAVEGRMPRRAIAAGTVVQSGWLEPPKVIQRGETVKVEVVSGVAKLEADVVAESSGGIGDWIWVKNQDSKRRFRARVEAAGRVAVRSIL